MQHYRMTLSEAIEHYRKGWIAATALLYYYLKIRLKKGWKVTLHQREITKQLGIPKSSFYRAIENLSKERLINWESPNGLVVELAGDNEIDEDEETSPPNNSQQDEPIESHEWDLSPTDKTGSLTNETGSPTDGTPSLTDGTKTPDKPSPSIDSGDSSNSYQFFINSLSKDERENFLDFCKEKVKNLSQEVNDIEAWLAHPTKAGQNRWEVYYEKFKAAPMTSELKTYKGLTSRDIQEQAQQFREELKQMKKGIKKDSPSERDDSQEFPERTTKVGEFNSPTASSKGATISQEIPPEEKPKNMSTASDPDWVIAEYERNGRGQLPKIKPLNNPHLHRRQR